MFAAVDERFDTEEALFVRVGGKTNAFCYTGPATGEILDGFIMAS